ncbi:MAG TPA: oxidoreductase, partial [Phycisphaerales bacterium]|nr:oxidoreductase [Phycisphaerales bacterium]
IAAAVKESGILFAVCHVLRYTDYTRRLKAILDEGRIGRIVSIQHLEPVGYWHQAHSFVRGNWRNESESSFMLLAKSCHDLDWLRHVMGLPMRRVSSFGSLMHFRRDCRPAGAADRCLDCGVEAQCPYSAKRIYLERFHAGHTGWPLDVITSDLTEAGVLAALRDGPYGRCVYDCDNDVVDHQVVNIEFDDGPTATFTMTAFTEMSDRKTRIFGTRGRIEGDGRTLRVLDFLTDHEETIDTRAPAGSILGGHGGGDYRLMQGFVAAVGEQDPAKILSGPAETLESHLAVFAAERARREGRVVEIV